MRGGLTINSLLLRKDGRKVKGEQQRQGQMDKMDKASLTKRGMRKGK